MSHELKDLKEELEKELQDNILSWWMSFAPDRERGGFYGHIDHLNQVVEGAGKGAVLNARILWTFSAAYGLYRRPDYLETARRAFDYITRFFTDKKYGGVYWELEPDGSVRSGRKQIYAIAFTIYAMAEYHLASGDDRPLKIARGLFRDMEAHAPDRQLNGYKEALSRDWKPLQDMRLSEKDQNESKTMNTHLHILEAYTNLFRIWKDVQLEKALKNVLRLLLDRFVDRSSLHLNLFFDDQWTLRSSLISYGHDIEASWLLHEAAGVLEDRELIRETGQLAVSMARENLASLDADGGLPYEFFPETGEMDTDRHWWPQAEALVGYFNAFQLSGEHEFLAGALEIRAFIREHMIDPALGEWYWGVDINGKPQTEKEKAGFWKCPYHNGRACMEIIRRIEELNKSQI
ncbi:MAG: AGE family epimerase/isomerase [Bacteroidales bacterium]|nr:AGE family epimerase/isomerase [Bacteroidales bacterium]